MIGDVEMQMIKRRTGRSLTGDRPLFLALINTTFLLHGNLIKSLKSIFRSIEIFTELQNFHAPKF